MPDGWRLPEDPHHQPGSHAPDGRRPGIQRESLQKQAGLAAVYKAVAEQYGYAFAAAEDWITPEQLGVDFCHFTPEAHRIFAEKTAELVHQLLD